METLQNQNVLLFTRTMGLGGTENVVLQLCEILNPVVNKVVVCSCGGVNPESDFSQPIAAKNHIQSGKHSEIQSQFP